MALHTIEKITRNCFSNSHFRILYGIYRKTFKDKGLEI